MSIPEKPLTRTIPIFSENGKGGEKIASEWEELEKLSKDELIIELVKSRRAMRNICKLLEEVSGDGASHFMYDCGDTPSEAWLSRIVTYARMNLEPGEELDGSDLERYGVDSETADRFCYGEDW